ncbi:hypothetical protein D3C72_2051290 [compost metagenome]
MPLGDEVVLPSDTTEHPAILQLVSNPGAHQGHGEHRVNETRITALHTLERFLAIQFVDVTDRAHIDTSTAFEGHFA